MSRGGQGLTKGGTLLTMETMANEDVGFLIFVLSDWAARNADRADVADMVERAERLGDLLAECEAVQVSGSPGHE